MVNVDNRLLLNTDIESILSTLRSDLYKRGLNYFSSTKRTGNYIMTNCPIHKDGQERKPSCGVHQDTGFFHCFTCGFASPIHKVISTLFNYNDSGQFGIKYLKDNFQSDSLQTRSVILPPLTRNKQVTNYISESELSYYRYYHNYMWQRKLTPEIVEFFDVGYDKGTNCLTFPVNDISGNCLFVARRSVSTKFFNYPEDSKKCIYGLDKILRYSIKEVWVCESFINCLNCWQYGKPAIALMGTGSSEQYEILKSSGIKKYVLALDSDEAGRKGIQRFIKHLQQCALIDMVQIPTGKDINDLSEQEFNNLRKMKVNY